MSDEVTTETRARRSGRLVSQQDVLAIDDILEALEPLERNVRLAVLTFVAMREGAILTPSPNVVREQR